MVSMEEFTESKILKAKALFDEHVSKKPGMTELAATCEEMITIFQALIPAMTRREAEILYNYADIDGGGAVSFSEFLENQILRLLQVYESCNCSVQKTTITQDDLKIAFTRLDPDLDDEQHTAIFKSIDVDHGGSISFVELCQSHVLRAKTLFDRFDADRTRALTQVKCIECLRSFDKRFTDEEQQAMCDVLTHEKTGRIHLDRFIRFNIIKLTLAFRKYDKDDSNEVDKEEFKFMLVDLFRVSGPLLEELLNFAWRDRGDGGLTFLEYIQAFQELERRHELAILAKRRKEKEKAKRLGLVYRGSD
eukprot:TRINITY_DN9368_c1_g1_i1.p1 TRINITY_DN9368_c1_g1~~TRINITY_DN9368_c1_g1_i1.p1  ORF type:complete len:346 (+),score=68.68 TRINITY_DN9368_c1_g1_i1:123-1040(+)